MVVAIFLLMLVIFIVVDLILRKENKIIIEAEKTRKSPIFLSPEKALRHIANETNRLYHLSHSWVLSSTEDNYYVGYDKFIPTIFPSSIKVHVEPKIDSFVQQGGKLWDVKFNGRTISQLAPISGKVIDINPACKMDIPLPSDEVEQSWIVKMQASNFSKERNNLMNHSQAVSINSMLKDEMVLNAQHGHYLNDGGQIDPSYISSMMDEEWEKFVNRFFPYTNSV